MRVRLLRSVIRQGREHMAGAELDVSDGLGQSLIDGGAAKALMAPPSIKAILRAPRDKTKETSPDGKRI